MHGKGKADPFHEYADAPREDLIEILRERVATTSHLESEAMAAVEKARVLREAADRSKAEMGRLKDALSAIDDKERRAAEHSLEGRE